jgi:hypothetical protein
MSEMACGTGTLYPLKAWGDLKKFNCLYSFDIKGPLYKINQRGWAEICYKLS